MIPIQTTEYPPEIDRIRRRAVRLQWLSLAYLVSAATGVYLTQGSSAAMRASFFEDAISLVPGIAFLLGSYIAPAPPSPEFPYGKHRAVSIGHLTAALALLAMGAFLIYEQIALVLYRERATIGGMVVFGHTVWAGWPMLVALAWSGAPAILLGRMKRKLAEPLNDKVLIADARMMQADWMTAGASAVGVIGIGLGIWWLDPLAALIVGLDIAHDGISNLRVAVADLIDRRPASPTSDKDDPLPERLRQQLCALDWVADARVRMRDAGHIYLAEAYIVPGPGTDALPERIAAAEREAKAMEWRLQSLTIQPVTRLPALSPEEASPRDQAA